MEHCKHCNATADHLFQCAKEGCPIPAVSAEPVRVDKEESDDPSPLWLVQRLRAEATYHVGGRLRSKAHFFMFDLLREAARMIERRVMAAPSRVTNTREEPDFEWWRLQGINACIERMKTLAKERDDALALSTNTQTLMADEQTMIDQQNRIHQLDRELAEEHERADMNLDHCKRAEEDAATARALKNAAPQVSSRPNLGGQSSDTDTPAVAAISCAERCHVTTEEERCVDCPERCDKARSGYVQGYCEAAAMGRELCACQCIECEAKENKAIAEASE